MREYCGECNKITETEIDEDSKMVCADCAKLRGKVNPPIYSRTIFPKRRPLQ